MMLLSGRKSFRLGRQQLAFFGVQLILIKQEMGRNVSHICRLLQQLTQDLELRRRFLAELLAHLHVEIFCSSFEWGSLIKSLKSRAFAQYAPLPSLQSVITCNSFAHNEGSVKFWFVVSGSVCVNTQRVHFPLGFVLFFQAVQRWTCMLSQL